MSKNRFTSSEAKKIGEKLIDMNIIGALGSDMHHMKHAMALQKCISEKHLQKVFEMPLINRYL